jgi:nitrite reductase (NADH) small subunit
MHRHRLRRAGVPPALPTDSSAVLKSNFLKGFMANFTKLTTQSELPPEGEAKEFPLGDKVICVANVNGTVSAMDNVCLHRGGPLGQGVIEGDKLVCPWHGWQWDPKTGQAGHNPAAKVAVYPLKVENGDVMIEM